MMQEEQSCCAGLAGICLAGMQQPDLVPALKRQGRQGCPTRPGPAGCCSWLQGDVSPRSQSRLLPREQPLDMRVLAWVSSYANEFIGMY